MLLRLRNAAASMGELAQRQDRVASNLANANTIGYRRDRAFSTALAERIDREGAPQSTRVAGQAADVAPGVPVQTGNPLDLALEGDGLFAIRDTDGRTRYTRAGEFLLDAEGTVRTTQGHALLTTDGDPLTLPPSGGEIGVNTAGEVSVGGLRVGRIATFEVADPAGLVRLDGATFEAAGVAARPSETRMRQGFLEGSNVDAVGEMVELMSHVRLFESQQKALRSADDSLGAATRDLGSF
ncbi:flagellar hook-basal body protein [Rubrivirga sp. IMCC43871]|uniref:flagellar hook-basal body protein n=1 Tax=Rubrivirga sp. IMCC43871 TaxID=3391575 RepID=UPI00398FEB18